MPQQLPLPAIAIAMQADAAETLLVANATERIRSPTFHSSLSNALGIPEATQRETGRPARP